MAGDERKMINTIIFDMDGVIIDSITIQFQIWKDLMKKHDVELSDEFLDKVNGMNTPEIARRIVNEFALDVDAAELAKEKRMLSGEKVKEGIPMFEGVKENLSVLKKLGYKIGLATMSPRKHVEYALGKNLFDLEFDAIVTDDDVQNPKPSPEIFLKCAQELKSEPEECVVVEDAINGIEAARAAGMYAIAVTTTTGKKYFTKAHAIMQKTSELNSDLINALSTKVEEKNV